MPYVVKWSDLPEVEILKGNFRRSASGLKGSVNKIRLSHPSETPVHHHAEEEQTVLMLSGEMDVVIDKDTIRLGPDQVCVIPAGVPHLPANRSGTPCTAIIARTDPNEQESVVLLPELDALVD